MNQSADQGYRLKYPVPGPVQLILPHATTDIEVARQEWLRMRVKGLGGTDVAALVRANPYRQPYDVYASKVKPAKSDLVLSEAAEWGIRLEAPVAEYFAETTGFTVVDAEGLYADVDRPYLLATPDRLVLAPDGSVQGVLEVKTAGYWMTPQWEDGGVPEHYRLQTLWYAGLLGLKRAWVACLIGGQKAFISEIDVVQDEIDLLQDAATYFWNTYVLGDDEPLLDPAHRSTSTLLDEMETYLTDSPTDLSEKAWHTVQELARIKSEVRALKDRESELYNKVRLAVGPHTSATYQGQEVLTFRESVTSRIVPDKVREVLSGEDLERVTEQTVGRRLVLKKFKKETE